MIQVTANDLNRETTYILPPSRAVWIPPDTRHAVTVLEATELRTVYLDPSVTPSGWQGCRVLVVSSLMRELIRALEASSPDARDDALMALTLHEITHANTQSLGVPLPRDKRLHA